MKKLQGREELMIFQDWRVKDLRHVTALSIRKWFCTADHASILVQPEYVSGSGKLLGLR